MMGIPSSCPPLSSVPRISSLFRTSTQSPTLNFRLFLIMRCRLLSTVGNMSQYPLIHFKKPKRTTVFAATALLLALLWYPASRSGAIRPLPSAAGRTHGAYATDFRLTENPISEGGNWTNGHAAGIDWADIRTPAGLAFGAESGKVLYGDSTALLTGMWGPDQKAQATVHTVNQNDHIYEEVELRLRS